MKKTLKYGGLALVGGAVALMGLCAGIVLIEQWVIDIQREHDESWMYGTLDDYCNERKPNSRRYPARDAIHKGR